MKTQIKSFSILVLLLLQLKSTAQVTFTMSNTICVGGTETLTANTASGSAAMWAWAASPSGPVFSNSNMPVTTVTFPAPGVFTIGVVAMLQNGPSGATNTITVIAGPSISVSQTSQTTCIASNFPLYSKPVTLTATGAGTYVLFPYSPNNGNHPFNVRPGSTTIYTVQGFNGACPGSATVNVMVIPQFTIQVSPSLGLRCLPDSLKLGVTSVSNLVSGPPSSWTYSWTECSSQPLSISSYFTPTVTVYPQSTCNYTVQVFGSDQCVSVPATATVNVGNCTGIDNFAKPDLMFIVYPNPARDQVHLKANAEGEYSIVIFNLLSEKVFSKKFVFTDSSKIQSVDMSGIGTGIYIIEGSDQNGIKQTMRLIKN